LFTIFNHVLFQPTEEPLYAVNIIFSWYYIIIIIIIIIIMKLFFLFWNYKGTVKVWYWYSPYCIFIHIQYIIQGERGIIGSRFLILFLASVVRSIIINFSQYTVPSHSTYCSSTWIYFYLSLLKGSRQESQRLIIDKIIRAGSGGRQRIKFLKSHGYENYSSSTE